MADLNDLYKKGVSSNSDEIKQQYPDTCAIKSQEIIMNSKGFDVSESELREEAMQNGWYKPGSGTPFDDTGNLLEIHGLQVRKYEHASLADIDNELSQGHNVIVGVDSGELWNPSPRETFEDIIQGKSADHALIASGFAIDPFTGDKDILLTDPGTGDICKSYSSEQFKDAWDDSDNFMVSSF